MSNRPGGSNQIGCAPCLLSIGALFGVVMLVPGIYALVTSGRHGAQGYLLASTLLIGIGAPLAYFLARRQRRARIAAMEDKQAVVSWRDHAHFPKLKTRQGTRGVKLASEMSIGCRVIVITLIAIVWNGISIAAAVGMWNENNSGTERILGLSCISIFLLIGLLIAYGAVHQFLLMVLTGKTCAEISSEPAKPGEEIKAWLYQAGYFDITSVKVVLKCIESVTYRQGTDTVTHHQTVHEETLLEREHLRAMAQDAFVSFQFRVPESAMHSFKASRNAITWQLEVTIVIPGRPDVSEKYPFRVAPEVRS